MVVCRVLKQEWNDRLASSRIVGELLLVVAMLAQSPDGHLIEAGHGEQTSCARESGSVVGTVSGSTAVLVPGKHWVRMVKEAHEYHS